MENSRRRIQATLGFALALCAIHQAHAQSATVTLSSQKQYIRGYGGMQHAAWAGDMTAAERTLAFGSAAGQLNFSILRIPVTDGNPGSGDVATAKAAIAAGAIVMATPWNAAHTYTSADFASYLTHLNNFVSYMKGQGVNLYSISVQNEPDYGAQAGWGSWTAAACHDFILNYGAQVTTKLMGCESFNYQKSYYDAVLNDSAALANVALFGTHLYGTPVSGYAYANWNTKGAGKEMWMTEHYTDSTTDANSWPNALGVATEIHNTMVTGQMNGYVWWYIKRSYGFINGGAVTKRGDCIGHWSKFVRPGFHRVDATASPGTGLALSAYSDGSSVVIIVVNTGGASTLSVSVPGSTITSYAKYTTSSSKSLASDGTVTASNGSMSVALDGSSVTSLVGTGNTGGGGSPGTGGATSTGGSAATGGSKAAGGNVGAGGTASTGGSKASGGSTAFANAGGSTTTGGSKATGGSVGASTGGTPQGAGGSKATGGSPAGLGGNDTGGLATTGGQDQTGTTPGAGGSVAAAGGAVTTGGLVGSAGDSNGTIDNELPPAGDTGSCSCRVAGQSSKTRSLALLSMFGVLALGSLRRRPKR